MSYTPTYKRPYEQWKELPSKETLCTAEVLTQYDDTFEHIEEYLESEGKKEYALLTEAGYSIVASIDEYYVLTVVLKNKAGDVLSTSEPIDLPIESMIINVDYDEESGILTFSLQNGQTLPVNISTLVRGLVPTSRKIAGVDLEDDITAEELKDALGMYDEGLTAGTLKPWLYDTEKEVEIGVYNGKPLYRQVYVYEEVSIVGGIAYVTIDVENPEEIYIENAYAVAPDGGIWPIPYAHSNAVNNIGVFISSDYKGLNFRLGTAHEGTVIKACVILNYTKTTDLEGSGNNLNPYGIYDAKLDDVKSSIASVSDEVDAVEEQLSDRALPQYKHFNLSATGWYRIAEFNGTRVEQVSGVWNNSCDIDIRKLYASTQTESHAIKYRANSDRKNTFLDEVSSGVGFDITKIRTVYNATTFESYIEIYYNVDVINTLCIYLSNQKSIYNALQWNLITPVATAETIDGFTVLATHKFSQNKSYESEIEAVQADIDAINSRLAEPNYTMITSVGVNAKVAQCYIPFRNHYATAPTVTINVANIVNVGVGTVQNMEVTTDGVKFQISNDSIAYASSYMVGVNFTVS